MFAQPWIWIVMGLALAAAGALCIWLVVSRKPRRATIERARRLFHVQRERIEHRFFMLASKSGKPRGLEWVDCDFEDGVSFARDRHSGCLRALVGVTVHFQAVEGGGMEDNPNVGLPRAATAVFHLDGDDWS